MTRTPTDSTHPHPQLPHVRMPPQCQLITYPDSLGGNLTALHETLSGPLRGLFGGVHILPFFPSSGDRGFAAIRYDEIEPAFGTWEELQRIAQDHAVMCDFMVNHVSRRSPQFLDFQARKDDSPYRDMFLRTKYMHPSGSIPEEDLAKVYTRKPRAPLTEVTFADGSTELLWCTFDEEQIDLNLRCEVAWKFIGETLHAMADVGIRMIRIDAFGYTTKRLGTTCFFVEPEIWEHLARIRSLTDARDVAILPEMHEHHSLQIKLADHGYWVYDFALPMLVLHALYTGRADRIAHWLRICPRHQVTTLDTHDGLPVVDVIDLLSEEEIEETKTLLFSRGANVKRRYNSAQYQNLDIYQINCTYYSALGDNDDAYIAARVLQLFAPGVPQIYYVGLLAGSNDIEKVERSKVGRDINRHDYTKEEIDDNLAREVVQRLFRLIRFRNAHPAFGGGLVVEEDAHRLTLRWSLASQGAGRDGGDRDPSAAVKKDPASARIEQANNKSAGGREETVEAQATIDLLTHRVEISQQGSIDWPAAWTP